MSAVDRVMDRVAYWPGKPPRVDELKQAHDERVRREEERKELVSKKEVLPRKKLLKKKHKEVVSKNN